HVSGDVLGVLVARVCGQTLGDFLRDRVFEPLGMHDTAFRVPTDKLARLTSSYRFNHATNELDLYDGVADSQWHRQPEFESGGGGLVSTVDDCYAFFRMMLDKGRHRGEQILSRAAVELMTTDQLTA